MAVAMRSRRRVVLSLTATLLVACGGGDDKAPSTLRGQVGQSTAAPQVSFYAASRLLEQATFGPTPASVARVQQLGMPGWIDWQLGLPASRITSPNYVIDYDVNNPTQSGRAFSYFRRTHQNLIVGGEDQLRLRTNWVLSNFLVVSTRKINVYGAAEYFNLLQQHAFGNYGDLLKAISRSPAMGFYLDNSVNTRQSLNENYGRELMQLFSVGLVQLNLDGTPKRDASGKALETYTQQDVVEATRALTGWTWAEPEATRPGSNFANYGKPMVAYWADQHDPDPKRVLGKVIPANQGAEKDLDSLIKILMEHPNTAPFVSLRLIQGLTASDPSPQYLQRVAAVFQQSGGDLGKVVRAILLDSEARAGDVPGRSANGFGRIREPLLMHTALLRALGCTQAVSSPWGDPTGPFTAWNQQAFDAPSVFNFYPPNHRAPGSLLLAPEQKMLTGIEWSRRIGGYHWIIREHATNLLDAGCDLAPFERALAVSEERLLTLLGERMFRGAMPPVLREGLLSAFTSGWVRQTPRGLLGAYVELAQATPAYGVTK